MAEEYNINVEQVINKSADDVWDIIKNFGNLLDYCTVMSSCEITNGMDGTEVGCKRKLMAGDNYVMETLLENGKNEEGNYIHKYTITDTTLFTGIFDNYVATITVSSISDTSCSFVWSSTYNSDVPEHRNGIINLYISCIDIIRNK
eukprot:TRINITY_DN220_c1_g1_i1.p1 TRINITY_DN220_c1_g1~~TRINITY_DN220_c1_g1_i1.p1  ORF type:complete len:146 (+),score=33.32 TRINITY_DN220_c1_g1_i1:553-990(+)